MCRKLIPRNIPLEALDNDLFDVHRDPPCALRLQVVPRLVPREIATGVVGKSCEAETVAHAIIVMQRERGFVMRSGCVCGSVWSKLRDQRRVARSASGSLAGSCRRSSLAARRIIGSLSSLHVLDTRRRSAQGEAEKFRIHRNQSYELQDIENCFISSSEVRHKFHCRSLRVGYLEVYHRPNPHQPINS